MQLLFLTLFIHSTENNSTQQRLDLDLTMANADGGKPYKWETLKGMPTKRVFSTPVEAKGSLYVVGGCDQMGTPIDAFEVKLSRINGYFQ